MRRLVLIAAGLIVLAAACTSDGGVTTVRSVGSVAVGTAAPTLPITGEWLNTSNPVPATDLTGKVTLVHFWRQSCLSCLETVEEIAALRTEFGDNLLVVGVHSPKFPRETDPDVVQRAIQEVQYPGLVINDPGREVWSEWGIQAWPTIAVVNHTGQLAGGHVGLGAAETLQPLIQRLVTDAAQGDRATAVPSIALTDAAPTILSYPEAVLADPTGDRLFIADTGHHRIVVAALDTHEVLAVIGSGDSGSSDGAAPTASFSSPRGMALDETTLYVADTGNHLIRAVDLASFEVTTVAGTGERAPGAITEGSATQTALSAPWDLAYTDQGILVTLAGSNQLVLVDLDDASIRPYAGTGRQGTTDGASDSAEFAMPTGLAVDAAGVAYIADAESSSIRSVTPDGEVRHVAGPTESLFDIGDIDGVGPAARLQRPLGMAFGPDVVWVADTYNSKIKRIGPTGDVETLIGGEGWRDGPAPLFSAPADIEYANGVLYVADRDNHSIRIVDPASGATSTVILEGIEQLVPDDATFDGTIVALDTVEVGAGSGTVVLDVTFPPGYKANELTRSRFEWVAKGDVVLMPEDADISVSGPAFPMQFEFTFSPGEGRLQGDIWLVYCENDTASICLFDRARIDVPLRVSEAGSATVDVAYEVTLPDGL